MNMENSPFIQKVLEEKCIPIDVLSEGADCVWLSKNFASNLKDFGSNFYYKEFQMIITLTLFQKNILIRLMIIGSMELKILEHT